MNTTKRFLIGAAATAVMLGGMALPALADKGGVPNDNSCLGQATAAYAQANGGAGTAVKGQAQNDPGPGRSGEVQAFKASQCPTDPSAN